MSLESFVRPGFIVSDKKELAMAGMVVKLHLAGGVLMGDSHISLPLMLDVADIVTLKGSRSNSEILKVMQEGDIFLFTSDRLDGWGAVANESIANGCLLVASDAIGSTHYLVKNKETGMIFRSCDLDSLYDRVKYLLDNPDMRKQISKAERESMVKLWSPANAAKSLLQLIEDIQVGRETSFVEGPCSKA